MNSKSLRTYYVLSIPGAKGPYHVHGIHIDTEWRSDWKWDRVLPHISPLKNRNVLDVGCGQWLSYVAHAGRRCEIMRWNRPFASIFDQFEAIRKLMRETIKEHLLPLGIEDLPKLEAFDTVFSMGVLYHRRSPLDHLIQLKDQLLPGGELILETLVIEGDETSVLVPVSRYAQMRNVYFFPSTRNKSLARAVGFHNVRIVDESTTQPENKEVQSG